MLLTLVPLVPLCLVLGMVALRFWGQTILAVLVWAMFEGAVRKWVFPGAQSQILLLKDAVLIFAYIGYLLYGRGKSDLGPKSSMLLMMLVVETAFCLIELVNPNSPSQLLSVFGLKNYLIYLPLAFIVPEIIRDSEILRKLMIRTCILAIPLALLGLYQFSQPPTSWVNQYVTHEGDEDAAPPSAVAGNASLFGGRGEGEFRYGRARTSSTFSYIGGFVTFLLLAVPLPAALLLASVPKRREALIAIAALGLSIGATATTGSRTPMVVFIVAAPLMVAIASSKRLMTVTTAVRTGALAMAIGIGTLAVASQAFSALQTRVETSDSATTRFAAPFTELAASFETSPLIGTGLGSNSNAAQTLMGGDYMWWLDGHLYELETARVMQEVGFVGFTLVFIPKIFVIFLVFKNLRRANTALMVSAQMTALVFVMVHLILFTINNPTGGLMYWTIVGVSIGAARVEAAERQRIAAQSYYLDQGYPIGDVAFA